jgi:hypothetical protein
VAELTDLEAALWEIENLVRAPLSPAEEAIFIDRRRELREELYGKAKALGAVAANTVMGRKHATAKLAGASSFTADTAKTTGKSARSIQRVVQRAAQNGRRDLARIAGTSLDRGAELDALPLDANGRVVGWRAVVARGSRPTPRLQPLNVACNADFPHCAPPIASRQSLWDLSCWGDFRPVASHSIGVEQP